jgi:hypothetical protein
MPDAFYSDIDIDQVSRLMFGSVKKRHQSLIACPNQNIIEVYQMLFSFFCY